ncbi:hypothetical protein [Streptosporangium saharense]|uniref:Uncharacterized protein n=1 Tax=Streptosporangium saharense TaxID=1706840 RepID=A0A7W7QVM2_9ACTN|nr:hypothetical protein [Streptosporangium saharense]MBB4920605.1 hypothetical protein [Streptosporangium saharense]
MLIRCEWLSMRMIQSAYAVLRNALEPTVREEAIPRNATKLVKIPAPKRPDRAQAVRYSRAPGTDRLTGTGTPA